MSDGNTVKFENLSCYSGIPKNGIFFSHVRDNFKRTWFPVPVTFAFNHSYSSKRLLTFQESLDQNA